MKKDIRSFVAATLPAAVKESLVNLLQPYTHPATRFIPEQNLHLTLFFIGNTNRSQLPALQQALAAVAQQQTPFTLELERIEPGPKPATPRLIWARYRQHTAFESLSRAITEALAATPPKQQKAIPHVTLARFRKDRPAPGRLPTVQPEGAPALEVDSVSLWQSELASPHPVYSVLDTYLLG